LPEPATDLGQENMGNNKASKRLSARRAATFLAALGALVMSSGVVLMATATSANAAQGPSVCHPVNGNGELGNGWNLIPPDHASSHIDESLYPDGEYWKHESKDGRHDVYADEEGNCPGDIVAPIVATASVTFTDPSCDNGNVASYSTSGENVEFDHPAAVAGQPITVTATATGDAEFEGGGTTATFDHTFTAAEDCSTVTPPVVSPPVVSPPKQHHTSTVTPTVVHAGLAGVSSEDMRGEQGLALMFAGMLMLVAAGGLGLRVRGSESRI
jgi:hypothetical protein